MRKILLCLMFMYGAINAIAQSVYKDVAPIFIKRCTSCHHEDMHAPSFATYTQVFNYAGAIKAALEDGEMPPWLPDTTYTRFTHERIVTASEKASIIAWVDGGAKEGNPKDLPALPKLSETWEIGKPDVVLTMPQDFELPAKGADDYIYIRVPTNFTEDQWIQAAEFRPGNKRVVHHAVVFIETPMFYKMAQDNAKKGGKDIQNPISIFENDGFKNSFRDGTVNRTKPDAPVVNDACAANRNSGGGGAPLLAAYAPGKNADVFPVGTAKRIPAGSNLIFQMHYAKTTGATEKDRTSIALVFAKQPVEKIVESLLIVNEAFAIPPGAENHEATACANLRRDVELINYFPHMHVRGKAMKYEVIYPDGKRETLLNVERYFFNWQTLYKLKQPVALPKGARIMVTGWFDNSTKNKLNPDPTKTVRFGEPTYDEMLVGFVDIARAKPAERPVAKVAPQILDSYVGEYSAGIMKFTLTREGNLLFFSIPNQPALPATPETETKFYFKEAEGIEVNFVKNEQGEVTEIQATLGQQKLTAKRVNKAAAQGTSQ